MGDHFPSRPPLNLSEMLLVAAAIIVVGDVVQLARVRDFAWPTFFLVGRWSLLAYLVISGMLEYVFVFDGARGASPVVMTCMLVIFAVDVPMLFAISVARYQTVDGVASR